MRQIAELGPELDFLALAQAGGEKGNVRDRISRWMKTGLIVGVVPGIYVTALEFRKRPVSLEILANMIYGPSYVSFEYVLAHSGLIPEDVRAITSATSKRNHDVNTSLGRFSYRHLPIAAYAFGFIRQELPDGSGYLVARPEKALLDSLYRAGAARSTRALEARLFEDLRVDPDLFRELDASALTEYAALMPGDTFRLHFPKLMRRQHA
jgi:predicted transcriptional regulator of viral defense system